MALGDNFADKRNDLLVRRVATIDFQISSIVKLYDESNIAGRVSQCLIDTHLKMANFWNSRRQSF